MAAERELQRTVSGKTHTHTLTHFAAAWLARRGRVGGQKGQMGIFANVTLVYGPVASEGGAEFGGQTEGRPFWTQGEIGIAT